MATPSGYPEFLATCPHIQERLEDVWLNGPWPMLQENIPHLTFLASATNKRDIVTQIAPGNGGVRTVQVVYTPRMLESLGTANVSNPKCDATMKIGQLDENYTIDPDENYNFNRVITATDLREACALGGDATAYVDSVIAAMIDAADRYTATRTATQSVALTGKWSSDIPFGDDPGERNNSNQLVLNTLVSAGKLNPEASPDLMNALNDSGYNEAYIFGGREGRTWNQLIAKGCCTNDGIDLGAIHAEYGQVFGYDKRVASALGTEKELLILTTGAQQLIQYTAARNDFKPGSAFVAVHEPNFSWVVVQSPRTGVIYDLTVKSDCGSLYLNVIATTKVIALPSDMAVVGDHLNGVNGSFQGVIVNAWAS